MGDFLGLLTFVVSVILVLWVAGEMLGSVLPAPVTAVARALFRAAFFGLVAIGRLTENLALALWRGQPRPTQRPQVSTISPLRASAYVEPSNDDDTRGATDSAVADDAAEGRNAIATAQGERNEVLSRNVVTRAQADIIARLLKAETLYIPDGRGGHKRLGQTDLIRLATGLSPNGRADSEYGQLRAELETLTRPTVTVRDRDGTLRDVAKSAS